MWTAMNTLFGIFFGILEKKAFYWKLARRTQVARLKYGEGTKMRIFECKICLKYVRKSILHPFEEDRWRKIDFWGRNSKPNPFKSL